MVSILALSSGCLTMAMKKTPQPNECPMYDMVGKPVNVRMWLIIAGMSKLPISSQLISKQMKQSYGILLVVQEKLNVT